MAKPWEGAVLVRRDCCKEQCGGGTSCTGHGTEVMACAMSGGGAQRLNTDHYEVMNWVSQGAWRLCLLI
jgi:hypothetical protein